MPRGAEQPTATLPSSSLAPAALAKPTPQKHCKSGKLLVGKCKSSGATVIWNKSLLSTLTFLTFFPHLFGFEHLDIACLPLCLAVFTASSSYLILMFAFFSIQVAKVISSLCTAFEL